MDPLSAMPRMPPLAPTDVVAPGGTRRIPLAPLLVLTVKFQVGVEGSGSTSGGVKVTTSPLA